MVPKCKKIGEAQSRNILEAWFISTIAQTLSQLLRPLGKVIQNILKLLHTTAYVFVLWQGFVFWFVFPNRSEILICICIHPFFINLNSFEFFQQMLIKYIHVFVFIKQNITQKIYLFIFIMRHCKHLQRDQSHSVELIFAPWLEKNSGLTLVPNRR